MKKLLLVLVGMLIPFGLHAQGTPSSSTAPETFLNKTLTSPAINGAQLSGATLYADQMPGTSMAQKIGACLVTLYSYSTTGGTCIANVTGVQNWDVDPFGYAGGAGSNFPWAGTLELCGSGVIYLYEPVIKPQGWNIKGCGTGVAAANKTNGFVANPGYFPATYTTGTVTVGTAGIADVITGSGTSFTGNQRGCAFVTGVFNGTATLVSGSPTMTIASATFGTAAVGETVAAIGVPIGTTISALGTSTGGVGTVTLSANATATVSTAELINATPHDATYGIIHSVTDATHVVLGFGINTNFGSGAPSGSTFVIYCAMFDQGDGYNADGYEFTGSISNIALNGSNIPGVVGLMNWYSEEGTTANHVTINGVINIGLDIETNYAEQAGPYDTVSISPGTSATADTLLFVSRIGSTAMKPFQNATLAAEGGLAQLKELIDVQSDGQVLTGLHLEDGGIGIGAGLNTPCPVACPVGPNNSVSGLNIENVNVSSGGGTVVALGTVYGANIRGLVESSAWTHVLTDDASKCIDNYVNVGTYETSAYFGGVITNSSSSTVSCYKSWERVNGVIQAIASNPSATAWSPYIEWTGTYEPTSGVFSPDTADCYMYEAGGIAGASNMNCGLLSGNSGGFTGWHFNPGVWSPIITDSGITGSTQCVHANSSGVLSGTGSDCGTGSGGITALTSDVTASGSGSVAATIAAAAVTLAKQANFAASSLQGNPTGSPAAPSAITLGSGLSFSGTTLVASGSGITALTGDTTASGSGSVASTTVASNSNAFPTAATVLGDVWYGSAAHTLLALAGNTTASALCLQQTGTGSVSAAPVWGACGGGGVSGANPTGTVGLSAVNGSAATFLRSDGAPPLSQGIVPTWTGVHTFSAKPVLNAGLTLSNAANAYTQTSTGLSLTSGTTGFGRDITGTVADASAVDGIIDFANITCTTCTATSYLVDWQVGGSSVFKIATGGAITAVGQINDSSNIQGYNLAVTGGIALGTGISLAATNSLQFQTNFTSAAIIDANQHWRPGGSATPTIASGACGATTNGTLSAAANDQAGEVIIGAAATTTCTVTFSSAYTTAPRAVMLTAGNAAAIGATVLPYVSAISTTAFTITGALLASTSFYYMVQ
jgi:hypothetical protein